MSRQNDRSLLHNYTPSSSTSFSKTKSRSYVILFSFIAIAIVFYTSNYWIKNKKNIFLTIAENSTFTSTTTSTKPSIRHAFCPVITKPNFTIGINVTSAYSSPNITSNRLTEIFSNKNFSNFSDFQQLIQRLIDIRRTRDSIFPIDVLFNSPLFANIPYPMCDGLWIEFGVYTGGSITKSANWKSRYCGNSSQSLFGFDSFEGLPSEWRPNFDRGHFNLNNNTKLNIPSNIQLVAGWFINTLPLFLLNTDRDHNCSVPVTYLHVDCDIYESTRDIFYLLAHRLVRGSIILFDELINYPSYEKHEIKVLFEYMSTHTDFHLQLIAVAAGMQINPTSDSPYQAVAFVVA